MFGSYLRLYKRQLSPLRLAFGFEGKCKERLVTQVLWFGWGNLPDLFSTTSNPKHPLTHSLHSLHLQRYFPKVIGTTRHGFDLLTSVRAPVPNKATTKQCVADLWIYKTIFHLREHIVCGCCSKFI